MLLSWSAPHDRRRQAATEALGRARTATAPTAEPCRRHRKSRPLGQQSGPPATEITGAERGVRRPSCSLTPANARPASDGGLAGAIGHRLLDKIHCDQRDHRCRHHTISEPGEMPERTIRILRDDGRRENGPEPPGELLQGSTYGAE